MDESQIAMANRLRQAREAAGWADGTTAARAIGVAPPTYLGHENGSRGYRDKASRYADFFKVNLEWLLTGRGVMKRATGPAGVTEEADMLHEPAPRLKRPREQFPSFERGNATQFGGSRADRIPMLGIAEGGDDGWSLWNGDVIETVPMPPELVGVTNGYGVYCVGVSMVPRYLPGESLYVHPGKPVLIGSFVIVQVKPKNDGDPPRALIKQLVKKTGTKIVLEQFNPSKQFDILLKDVVSVHVIVGTRAP